MVCCRCKDLACSPSTHADGRWPASASASSSASDRAVPMGVAGCSDTAGGRGAAGMPLGVRQRGIRSLFSHLITCWHRLQETTGVAADVVSPELQTIPANANDLSSTPRAAAATHRCMTLTRVAD